MSIQVTVGLNRALSKNILETVRTTADLKRKILALLKKDEEFRYAVVGLLGLEDLRSGQARLESSTARLEEAQTRLQEAIQKLAERQGSLEATIQRLVEAQTRTEVVLQDLSRQVGRLSDTVGFGLEDIARVVVLGCFIDMKE